jgi:hypothetical protein
MVRSFAVAVVLSCLAASAGAQTESAPGIAATPAIGPAGNKLPPKNEASAKPPVAADSRRCQLGVIPIAGNQFAVQKVGFGIFGNEYTRVRVDNWGFDDLVVARVRAAAPGNAVRRILYDKKELQRGKQTGSLFRDINSEIKDFARDVSAGANCERYIVVHLDNSKVFDSPKWVHGMSIVNVGSPIKRRNYLFALTYIRIYDGQSFEIIKQGAASTGDEPLTSYLLRLTPFRGPKRELDEASFPATPAQAVTDPVLREGVRALLATSLDKTLLAMLRQ